MEKTKEITLNGRTFEVRESLGDPNCFILTYGDCVVLEDSACEDFYGDIDEVADRMKEYIREECAKPFPWFTLLGTIVVTDADALTLEDSDMAERYACNINTGSPCEVTDKKEFEDAKRKLDLEDWEVSHIYSYNYAYGKRGYFCLNKDRT